MPQQQKQASAGAVQPYIKQQASPCNGSRNTNRAAQMSAAAQMASEAGRKAPAGASRPSGRGVRHGSWGAAPPPPPLRCAAVARRCKSVEIEQPEYQQKAEAEHHKVVCQDCKATMIAVCLSRDSQVPDSTDMWRSLQAMSLFLGQVSTPGYVCGTMGCVGAIMDRIICSASVGTSCRVEAMLCLRAVL